MLTPEQMIDMNSDVVAPYLMNCREDGPADAKIFFWSSPVFSGKNSSSANVKALWGQFGPTLFEKGRLCKTG